MAFATVALAFFAYQQSQIVPAIQSQARDLAEQTRYITRPADLHLVLDFHKARGGVEAGEIRNPINLTIVNTGAQLGIVSRVVVNYTEVDRRLGGVLTPYISEDAAPFPVKIIPPGGGVTQPTYLHAPARLTLNDTGWFKTAFGRHLVAYTIKVFNESSTQPIITSDYFAINWQDSPSGVFGICDIEYSPQGDGSSLCSPYISSGQG